MTALSCRQRCTDALCGSQAKHDAELSQLTTQLEAKEAELSAAAEQLATVQGALESAQHTAQQVQAVVPQQLFSSGAMQAWLRGP